MHPELVAHLKPALTGKRVLLGISGSIAAFKAHDIVRGLRECGAQVRCVLTQNGARFVTPVTLENLSGQPVGTTLWETGSPYSGTHHIDAARWADVAVVAPATASTIARLAHGLADDLLSTELLAFQGPLLIAPAMNPAMYANAATQANLRILRERGVRIVGPAAGLTSCGEEGEGRMLEPESVLQQIARTFDRPSNGKKLLLTLGPTLSDLDPVRYLTNRSSGRMGAAIAWAALRAGFEVTAVTGPCPAVLPEGIRVKPVRTSQEMLAAAESAFATTDVLVSTAAVLDWEISNTAPHKLKKEDGPPAPAFTRSPDILATLGARKRPGQFILGFAAETQAAAEAGRGKRLSKNCDAVFANDVSLPSQGFESALNGGWWIDERQTREIPVRPKAELAGLLIELILEQWAQTASPEARAPGPAPSRAPELAP